MSGARITTTSSQDRKRVLKPRNIGAPGEIAAAPSAPWPRQGSARRSLRSGDQIACGDLSNSACLMSGVRIKTTSSQDRKRVLKLRNIGAPGEIARGGRRSASAPLRPAAAPRVGVQLGHRRPSCRTRLVSCREFELSSHAVRTNRWSSSQQALVRPERFELPTSWFVARRSIQLSYGRASNKHHPGAATTTPSSRLAEREE